MGIFDEVKGMVGTAQSGLQIAQHGVDRFELILMCVQVETNYPWPCG